MALLLCWSSCGSPSCVAGLLTTDGQYFARADGGRLCA
jgi:hypothetical protein